MKDRAMCGLISPFGRKKANSYQYTAEASSSSITFRINYTFEQCMP
jgi:hypothetical protein